MASIFGSSVYSPAVYGLSQNLTNLVAYPNQQVQYFAQGQSNPPGQTADLILRNINSIIALLSFAEQTTDFSQSQYSAIAAVIKQTVIILNDIQNGIITKFANNKEWFSAILPYKGYASMSSTNSFYGQPNLSSLLQSYNNSGSGCSILNLAYLIYSKLYALNSDLQNYELQINRYTYRFIAIAHVKSKDYSSITLTQEVKDWFNLTILPEWYNVLNTPTTPYYNWPTNTNGGFYWAEYIEPILSRATTNAVVIEQLIPSDYTASPTGVNSNSSFSTDGTQIYFLVYMFSVIAIVLGKQLKSLNLSAQKIAMLVDKETHDKPFEDVSASITSAEHTYLTYLNQLLQKYNFSDPSTGKGPFLDFTKLANINTNAALDSRNCSADPNRSPGSFQPTILYQRTLVDILLYLSGVTQLVNYVNSQPSAFSIPFNAFVGSLTTVRNDLTAAFDFLEPRKDIHYGQWPQNMSNI